MKKRTPFVESSAEPVVLNRAGLRELLQTLEEDGHNPEVTWNAVDALELLVEAGHFRVARALANNVVLLVCDSPRERLFRGYVALCTMMEEGMVFECARTLEGVHAEILAGGHSAGDRARAALLLARVLFMGVSLALLPDTDLLRARAVLEAELTDASDGELGWHRMQLGLELVKTYLYAPKPELLQAQLLLQKLEAEAEKEGVWTPQAKLELLRLRYHLQNGHMQKAPPVGCARSVTVEDLRRAASEIGEIEGALVELTAARISRSDQDGLNRLRQAVEIFEKHRFCSGTIEALLILADASLAEDMTTRANVLFTRVADAAREGGSLQALLLALLGSSHCALSSGETERATSARRVVEDSLKTEIGIGAVGFSAVQAAQLSADYRSAIRCATHCERLFRQRGIRPAQAQALYLLGSAHAASGAWARARKAWGDAVNVEDLRRATVSASDKRAALAQAVVMSEHSVRGYISDQGRQKAEKLLSEAEKALVPFENAPAVLRAQAKILSVRAQLCVMSQSAVAAVSCLHKARETYERLGSVRDVALTDALSGLALLEAGKSRGGELYEEAHTFLRQALDFFNSPQHGVIRWKLKYYLAMAAYLSSQARGHGRGGLSWRETSASWLRAAIEDAESLASAEHMGGNGSDFSPGLTPEVMEPLKKALGMKITDRIGSSSRPRPQDKLPGDGGYLH